MPTDFFKAPSAISKELYGPRLILKKVQRNTNWEKDLFGMYSDEEAGLYNRWQKLDNMVQMGERMAHFVADWEAGGLYRWVILHQETGEALGVFVLVRFDMRWKEVEIGFNLAKKHWRKGYMSETLNMVKSYLYRELKLERITALVSTQNKPALALLNGNNFQIIGKYPGAFHKGNIQSDLQILQNLKEWNATGSGL